jgi:hypothetical protein
MVLAQQARAVLAAGAGTLNLEVQAQQVKAMLVVRA